MAVLSEKPLVSSKLVDSQRPQGPVEAVDKPHPQNAAESPMKGGGVAGRQASAERPSPGPSSQTPLPEEKMKVCNMHVHGGGADWYLRLLVVNKYTV